MHYHTTLGKLSSFVLLELTIKSKVCVLSNSSFNMTITFAIVESAINRESSNFDQTL